MTSIGREKERARFRLMPSGDMDFDDRFDENEFPTETWDLDPSMEKISMDVRTRSMRASSMWVVEIFLMTS